MPVTLERAQFNVITATHNGTMVPLSEAQKSEVLFYKYISTNADLTDYFPAEPWMEQIVADLPLSSGRARLKITDSDGEERGVVTEDGLIINIAGKKSGIYSWDGVTKRYLTMEEAEMAEETSGQELPTSERWSFHLVSVFLTDGPTQRDLKFRSDEQKAEIAKQTMYETIGNAVALAFQHGARNLAAAGGDASNAKDMLKAVDMVELMEEVRIRMGANGAEIDDAEVRERILDATDMTKSNAQIGHNSEEEDIEVEGSGSDIQELLRGK